MTILLKNNISIDPEILGGAPVVAGTRIPVERIKELVKQGYTTEDLKNEYPQVAPQKIQLLISLLMEEGLNAFTKIPQKMQTST